MSITLYTKPTGCFGCKQTKEKFDAAGVPYEDIDITDPANAEALAYVTEELKYSQVPIVVVDDEDHWSGLDPDNITRICARLGANAA